MKFFRFAYVSLLVLAVPANAATTALDPVAQGRGYIKPAAPVEVRYRLLGQAAIGAPVELEIVYWPERGAEAVSATVEARRSMAVTRRGGRERVAHGVRDQAYRQVITLVPQEEGLHHVTVFASVQIDGEVQSRIVSVPVQVGQSTKLVRELEPSLGELTVGADGEPVMRLRSGGTITPVKQGASD